MAALNRHRVVLLALACLLVCTAVRVQSNPVNIPLSRVPLTLCDRAWRALNNHSPTHHLYAQGNLINAQELEEPPYKIYKFTYDLSPICGSESCPREACTIDLKQDENGEIETLNDSIQCMYFYPAEAQNEVSQEQQSDQGTSYQEQEEPGQVTENLAEQMNHGVELAHEVQEASDESTRPFIAVRAPNTNYCPGCPYELDPQLMGLLPFSDQALRSMDEQSKGDYKHKLIKIVKVTRQVPISYNVIRYQLLLLIGESKCLKNTLELDECALREDAPTRLCLVTFETKPWRQMPLKITKNNCTDSQDESCFSSTSQQPDLQSQSLVTLKYDEGQPPRTEAANAYQGLKDLLDNFTYAPTPSESNSEPKETTVTEPTMVKVVLNRSQDDQKIVGFTDKAKEYTEFLEDFYIPVKTEPVTPDTREAVKEEEFIRKKVTTENIVVEETANGSVNRMKRSSSKGTLVGAPSLISVNDPEIQHYAEKGLLKFSEQLDSQYEPIITEITDATVQIVSGKLYKIKAKLGVSDCPKGTKNNCQLQAGNEVKECLITVWSQPWIDQGSPSISVNCSEATTKERRRKREEQNEDDEDYSDSIFLSQQLKMEQQLFKGFKDVYNRTYATAEEESFRFRIFQFNLGIMKLLQETEEGTGQYGINQFADLSQDEFRKTYLGLRPDLQPENEIPFQQAEIPNIELPPSFDWRKKNVVTPVKDQGACGSCWAFSVTGNVEGQYAVKHGKLLSLSEQELVDCDDLDEGCNGGLPDNAYRAIEKLGGLELESDYPYEGEDEKCHFKKNKAKVELISAVNITSNETKMAQWLVANGPISIGINANAMQFYIGGVSHPFKFLCNPGNLDHGVLIVGYGTSKYPLFHKQLPYWIIKNSWGKGWGEQGYYRVFRGDGTCGLNTMATSAVVV